MSTDRLPLDDVIHVYRTVARYHYRAAACGVSWRALLGVAALSQVLHGHPWQGAIERALERAEAGEWEGWSYASGQVRPAASASVRRARLAVVSGGTERRAADTGKPAGTQSSTLRARSER